MQTIIITGNYLLVMELNKIFLLVDDDLDDLDIFVMALEEVHKNFTCIRLNNGADAIITLTAEDQLVPDFIFLDMNMPKMTGLQCLTKIRRINRFKKVKIFIYTTTNDSNLIEESKNLGADGLLVKPAGLGKLIEMLRTLLME